MVGRKEQGWGGDLCTRRLIVTNHGIFDVDESLLLCFRVIGVMVRQRFGKQGLSCVL